MKTKTKSCDTCLYMATHEKCHECLTSKEDYKDFNEAGGWKRPDYHYYNYEAGNWMERIIRFEIEGKRNIVIGGQGEAEVNTKWTPQETSKHLHYVSEQCGYMTGTLHHFDNDTKIGLTIYTTESQFRLVWSGTGISHLPARLLYIENLNDADGWNWVNRNPWNKAG